MSGQPGTVVAGPDGGTVDPVPLLRPGRRWTLIAGPVFSLLLLVAVAAQVRHLDLPDPASLMPTGIGFWLAFVVYYFMSPATEWIIFRRLWNLPAAGFVALVRKLVGNEVLMGYVGELYFYTWARRHAHVVAAPFGAIKDVTILSGLVGNAVTLVMVIVAAPLLGALSLGISGKSIIASTVVVLATSLIVLFFRQRLFTLPRRELWIIAGLHLARVILNTFVAALMWHLLLPDVALTWWVLLATLRLLVSRLPLLPNKDVVFAGLASFLVGKEADIAAAMALMATLILIAHLGLAAILGAGDLAYRKRKS